MNAIGDYAIIGDCRAAALVSKEGSIDWLCWPRFDSPSLFGAILDESAGRWSITPTGQYRIERKYIDGTNVLRTRFLGPQGSAVLTDLMPVTSEEEKRRWMMADHQILRILECDQGTMEIETVFDPRPKFGKARPRIRDTGALGIRIEADKGLLLLRTDMPHQPPSRGQVRSKVLLRAGDCFSASLTFSHSLPAVIPPLGPWSQQALSRSISWWRSWLAPLTYQGPCREEVIRSALMLKLLVYAPSGAIVAAPTTSLPERIGGSLNWDYRFCWLRDASLTARALFGLGFLDEAQAFVGWLLQATRLTQPELRILYDVHGNRPLGERTLDSLAGHKGSKPVRIGNAAIEQLQLDVYGEVIDAATQFVGKGGTLDRDMQRMLRAFGDFVFRHWQMPDEGIWEPRSGRNHNTHSRLLCWVAIDRLIELASKGHLPKFPIQPFEQCRSRIRREIEDRAWNSTLESYVARLEGTELDSSLLLLAWYGLESANSERMKKTFARIRQTLGAGDDLLYRYRTGDSPGEGAFGACSFWGAEYLALGGGTEDEARDAFERLCCHSNDVGLFAEEIDPQTGEALGNFPQAFTHVALINAALTLSRRLDGREPLGRRVQPAQAPIEEVRT